LQAKSKNRHQFRGFIELRVTGEWEL